MLTRTSRILVIGILSLAAIAPASAGAAQERQEQEPIEKIDLNLADEQELQRVPGIGPAMAQRIVEWRNEHGRFERIDDLLDISGIGVKTLEKLRPYLVITDEDTGAEHVGSQGPWARADRTVRA